MIHPASRSHGAKSQIVAIKDTYGMNRSERSELESAVLISGLGIKASSEKIGRGERIRTSDPLHPMQVRYQAAPRPDRTNPQTRVQKRRESYSKRRLGCRPNESRCNATLLRRSGENPLER